MTEPLKPLPIAELTPGYYWARAKDVDWEQKPHDIEIVRVTDTLEDADLGIPYELYIVLGGTENDRPLEEYDLFQRIEQPEIAP